MAGVAGGGGARQRVVLLRRVPALVTYCYELLRVGPIKTGVGSLEVCVSDMVAVSASLAVDPLQRARQLRVALTTLATTPLRGRARRSTTAHASIMHRVVDGAGRVGGWRQRQRGVPRRHHHTRGGHAPQLIIQERLTE